MSSTLSQAAILLKSGHLFAALSSIVSFHGDKVDDARDYSQIHFHDGRKRVHNTCLAVLYVHEGKVAWAFLRKEVKPFLTFSSQNHKPIPFCKPPSPSSFLTCTPLLCFVFCHQYQQRYHCKGLLPSSVWHAKLQDLSPFTILPKVWRTDFLFNLGIIWEFFP